MSAPTPHNAAKKGDFAKTVLMPGDPLRAKFIAENFLDNAVQVTSIRGMLGFTGTYKGERVSVMGSGMGIPSIGIYSYELFNFYDVDNIIRVGTAGTVSPILRVKDVVMGMGACTTSDFASQYKLPGHYAPIASFALLEKAVAAARALGIEPKVGNLLSSDAFYGEHPEDMEKWRKMNVLAVEMEAAGLYMNAANAGKNALAICTISDDAARGEFTTAEERQNSFTDMMKIALEVAIAK